MIDLEAIKENVEALYPAFKAYVKKRGFASYPTMPEIKLWFEFMKFIEEVDNGISNAVYQRRE